MTVTGRGVLSRLPEVVAVPEVRPAAVSLDMVDTPESRDRRVTEEEEQSASQSRSSDQIWRGVEIKIKLKKQQKMRK